MTKPVVWIVDSSHWPRAYLRAELIERGYDAVGFETLREAVGALRFVPSRRPRVVVVELVDQAAGLPLLQAASLPPLVELLRTGVPAVGVGGAVALADASVRDAGWAKLLPLPVTIGEIADAVQSLAPVTPR